MKYTHFFSLLLTPCFLYSMEKSINKNALDVASLYFSYSTFILERRKNTLKYDEYVSERKKIKKTVEGLKKVSITDTQRNQFVEDIFYNAIKDNTLHDFHNWNQSNSVFKKKISRIR